MSEAAAARETTGAGRPPPVPPAGTAILAVFRLYWRRLARGHKPRLGLVAVALVVVGVSAIRYAAKDADATDVVKNGIDLGFFRFLVFLLPFLFTSGAIAEEVELRTFPFLTSRPVSRASIAMGKLGAGVAMSLLLLLPGALIVHLACFATDPTALVDGLPQTLRGVGALALLCVCYGAICMFWGALVVEAAGIVSALYLAFVEFLFSFVPGICGLVSANYHARQIAGLPKGTLMPDYAIEVSVTTHIAVVSGVAVAFIVLMALVVQVSEYRFGKA